MVKRILVVNDIPGAGKVAGNINIPILSCSGFETLILPTLILSTQTGSEYNNIVIHKINDSFKRILLHWDNSEIEFDGYLTGYFADSKQIIDFIDYYQTVIQRNANKTLIIDPIMGDNGDYYQGFDNSILESYLKLIPYADIIMPNITEACFLSQTPFRPNLSEAEYYKIATRILKLGVKNVVITGIKNEQHEIGFYLLNANYSEGKFIYHKCFDEEMFGTGDIVVSLVTALYNKNMPIDESLTKAGYFIEKIIEETITLNRKKKLGLYFESVLCEISNFMKEVEDSSESESNV